VGTGLFTRINDADQARDRSFTWVDNLRGEPENDDIKKFFLTGDSDMEGAICRIVIPVNSRSFPGSAI
jgi:hypothetical protein